MNWKNGKLNMRAEKSEKNHNVSTAAIEPAGEAITGTTWTALRVFSRWSWHWQQDAIKFEE